MENQEKLKAEEMQQIERSIGKILRVGVVISVGVMSVGIILLLVSGRSGYAGNSWPHRIATVLSGLIAFKAYAWLMAGLFLLILTPVLRVVVSIYAFAKEHDRLYVWITTVVLVILLIAMVVGNNI